MKQSYLYIILFSLLLTACSSQSQANLAEKEEGKEEKDAMLRFNSMITVILEDSKGNFWFGSHCDGVCRYDGETFSYYTVEQGLPKGETHEFAPGTDWSKTRKVQMGNSIRSIQEDKKGNIYFNTGAGLSKFDGQSFTLIYPQKESVLITDSFGTSAKRAKENWQKEGNSLWFGTGNKNGAYRYDGQQLEHLTFPTFEVPETGRWSPYIAYSIYKDTKENLWFGTENAGIFRYDGSTFVCINEGVAKGVIRSFYEDNTGRIWIANNTVGLCYYDGTVLKNFTKEQGYYSLNDVRNDATLDDTKTLDGVQTIAQDKDGNLWFGTFSDGLWSYDGDKMTHFTRDNGLPYNTVKTIYKDKNGKLWFGIGDEEVSVYHFDGVSFDKFKGK